MYYVYDRRTGKFAEISSASESGVKANMPAGGRMTLEMNRSWIRNNVEFYKKVDHAEVIKQVGTPEEKVIDQSDITKLSYKELQAVAKDRGINPFGINKKDLIAELSK